jgi:PKD repeat protein/Tfp pilus assembly protein PilV
MPTKSSEGFSIIDGMVAAVIISVAFLSMTGALRNILRNNTESILILRATELANNSLEVASAKSFESLTSFVWTETEYPNLTVNITVESVDITGTGNNRNILAAPGPEIETDFKKVTATVTVPGRNNNITLSAIMSDCPCPPRPIPIPERVDENPLNFRFQDDRDYGNNIVDKWDWDLDGDGILDVVVTRVDRGHEPDVFNYIYTNNAHLNRVGVEPDAMGLPPPFEFSYGLADVYIASLEVQYADGGTYSKKKLIEVNVGESDDEEEEPLDEGEDEGEDIDPPTAEFAGIPTSGEAPLIVTFTDQSSPGTGTITGWQWDFGDGAGTSYQNPSHTYNDADTYTVTLRVTDDNSSEDSMEKVAYITVSEPETPPTANFTGAPTAGEAPLIVDFTNLSSPGTGTITGWQWDFGDDMGTSSDQNPSHTYTDAGTYTVDLTATDDNALQDIETKPAYITVTLPPEDPPIVQFSVDVGTGDKCNDNVEITIITDKLFTSETDIPITISTGLGYGYQYEIMGFNNLTDIQVTFSVENTFRTINLILLDTDNFDPTEHLTFEIDPPEGNQYERGDHFSYNYTIEQQEIDCHEAQENPGDLGIVIEGLGDVPYQGENYSCNEIPENFGNQDNTFALYPFRIKKEDIIDQFTGSHRDQCEMDETAVCLYAYHTPYGNQHQSNLQNFDIIQADASVFFLHIDPESDKVTLGMIHDDPACNDGAGKSEFKIKGFKKNNNSDAEIPLNTGDVIVADDPNGSSDYTEDLADNIIRLKREWNDEKTDGAMISLGTTWGEFCIETWPGKLQGATKKNGKKKCGGVLKGQFTKLNAWIFKSAPGIDPSGEGIPGNNIELEMGNAGLDRPEKKLTLYFRPRLIPKTPEDGADPVSPFPIFTWGKFSEIANYELKLCWDPALSVNCQDVTTTETSTSLNTPLASGDYYWRVKAINEDTGEFIDSEISSFRVP